MNKTNKKTVEKIIENAIKSSKIEGMVISKKSVMSAKEFVKKHDSIQRK
ncbi:MAG: hypothetical protein AB7T10_09785 [bacterium]